MKIHFLLIVLVALVFTSCRVKRTAERVVLPTDPVPGKLIITINDRVSFRQMERRFRRFDLRMSHAAAAHLGLWVMVYDSTAVSPERMAALLSVRKCCSAVEFENRIPGLQP